jgi:Arc/MetJ-type ribon-helix-helix transcriptional regulator
MLKEYLKLDSFKTKSEFIRNAVREKLEDELAKPRKGFVHDALRQVGEENEK